MKTRQGFKAEATANSFREKVITDRGTSPENVAALREKGLKVIQV